MDGCGSHPVGKFLTFEYAFQFMQENRAEIEKLFLSLPASDNSIYLKKFGFG
jgi:hypothetical protein